MTSAPHPCPLTCSGLSITAGRRRLIEALDLEVRAGEILCVLGRNGAGKSLALHTLAGLRPPAGGSVRLDGAALEALPRPEVARRLGLLTQSHDDAFPMTVAEAAQQGGFARARALAWGPAAGTGSRVAAALAEVDLTGLEDRLAASLSGGERRRLALATLLVQDPRVLLLDEPTNHLDPVHQQMLVRTLQRLAKAGKASVVTLHDPGLASRIADRVLMLYGDGRWRLDEAAVLLEPGVLEDLYGTPFGVFSRDGQPLVAPLFAPAPGRSHPRRGIRDGARDEP